MSPAGAVIGFAWLLSLQDPGAARAEAPRPELASSLSRIRTALKKPAPPRRLLRPPSQADFSIQILEKQRFTDLLGLIDFGSGPVAPGGLYAYQQRQVLGQQQSQPLFNVDVLAIGNSIGNAVRNAWRERAERLATQEVRRALVDFCAERECAMPLVPPVPIRQD